MGTKAYCGRTPFLEVRLVLFYCVGSLLARSTAGEIATGLGKEPRVRALSEVDEGISSQSGNGCARWLNPALYFLAKPGNRFGYVPTNTLSFQEYALETLIDR